MIEYFEVSGTVFSLDLLAITIYLVVVAVICYLGYMESMKSYSIGVNHGQYDFNGELVRTESEGFKRGYKAGITDVVDFIKADLARADAEVDKKPVQAKTTKPVVKAPIKKVVAKKAVKKPVKKVLVK
ncbi:MAG: hypothetical protein V4536_08695 [Pseudomonadota bacterium]